MRRLAFVGLLAVMGLLVVPAAASDVISVDVPINTVFRGDPGDLFLVATVPTGPGLDCQGGVDPSNNESEHVNSDIVFVSGDAGGTIFNVEVPTFVGQDIFFVSEGPTLIYVRLGDDGVFSAGFVAMLDCHEHEETTTTTVPDTTTTTEAPPVTAPPPGCPQDPTTPCGPVEAGGGATAPSDWTGVALMVGGVLALLLAGAAAVRGWRS